MINKLLAADTSVAPIDINPTGQFNVLGGFTIANIISTVIVIILVVAALLFFFMLILGGVKYITSGGDKAKAESARGMITAALIGLVIVFAAWAIVQLVQGIFGIDIFNLDVPTINSSQT